MEELISYLLSLSPLPAELQVALISRTTKETHRDRKTILPVGQVCDWIGFVESGLVTVCYDVPAGEERIVHFARENNTVFGVGSFTTNQPSRTCLSP